MYKSMFSINMAEVLYMEQYGKSTLLKSHFDFIEQGFLQGVGTQHSIPLPLGWLQGSLPHTPLKHSY